MFRKLPEEYTHPRRSLKLRKLVWTGTTAALIVIIGVTVAIAIVVSNNQKGQVSESTANIENVAPSPVASSGNETASAPIAVPLSTMTPSVGQIVDGNPALPPPPTTWNETTDVNATLAPTTTGGVTVDNTTQTTVAPTVVAPIAVAPSTPPPTYMNEPITTIFYAHADIPYNDSQKVVLDEQMKAVPLDAEFLIFVGDMREAGDKIPCTYEEYAGVAAMFRLSHTPVFVLEGDNDIADCPNVEEGRQLWRNEFIGFESKYWNHSLNIQRHEGYPDNFAFVHKKTLFMGLNIIGGQVKDATEWETRLGDAASWTTDLIRNYNSNATDIGRIVIFAHANPGAIHATYFETIASFIRYELNNSIPILYLNGDKHEWMYDPNFYGSEAWLRIGVTGLGAEPLLKFTIEADGMYVDPQKAFEIDRRL
jgi:hypothetical protein